MEDFKKSIKFKIKIIPACKVPNLEEQVNAYFERSISVEEFIKNQLLDSAEMRFGEVIQSKFGLFLEESNATFLKNNDIAEMRNDLEFIKNSLTIQKGIEECQREWESKYKSLEETKNHEVAELQSAKEAEVAKVKAEAAASIQETEDTKVKSEKEWESKYKSLEETKNHEVAELQSAKEAEVAKVKVEAAASIQEIEEAKVKGEKEWESKYKSLEEIKNLEIAELQAECNKAIAEKEANDKHWAEKYDALNDELLQWREYSDVYKPVQEALNKCSSLNNFLYQKGIVGYSIENLLKLISSIGKSLIFAEDLYKFLAELKRTNREEMTQEEILVYLSLNNCYKQVCGIDYDVFFLPGNQPFDRQYEKMPFDKKIDENLLDKNVSNLKYASGVYVPGVNSLQSGRLMYRVLVKASNF